MNQLVNFKLCKTDGVATMSSTDLVNYINATRPQGATETRHDNFMAKVPKVLGKDAPKFLGTQKYGNSITRKIYNFPKREACLMAMSYSYELQAMVFDAWQEAEASLHKQGIHPLIPQSFADALRLAADLEDKLQETKLMLKISEAEIVANAPKVAFHDTVLASDESHTIANAAKILGVKPNWFFAWLRGSRYLMENNVPYASSYGLIECALNTFKDNSGRASAPTSYITAKGMIHFEAKLRKQGHIPT